MALGQNGGWLAAKGLTVINGQNRDVIHLDARAATASTAAPSVASRRVSAAPILMQPRALTRCARPAPTRSNQWS
jgi:hypothetical protein